MVVKFEHSSVILFIFILVLDVVNSTQSTITLHLYGGYIDELTSYAVTVDGLYWYHTKDSVSKISGLSADKEYRFRMDILHGSKTVHQMHVMARTSSHNKQYRSAINVIQLGKLDNKC